MKNFKTFFAFAMLAVVSFMMVGCSEKDDPAPLPEPELGVTFEIEVTDITSNSSLITVTPSRDDVLYYFDNVSKEDFTEKYGGDVGAVAEGAFEQMVAIGMTLEEAIETYASLGKDSWRNSGGLTPDTKYVAYAVAISNEGKALSKGQFYEYRTLAEEKSDMTFEIEVTEITSTSALVAVTPSRDDEFYYFDIIGKDTLTEYHDGDVAAVAEEMLEDIAYQEDISIEEAVTTYASKGDDSWHYSGLSPNKEYVVFAVPINEQGKVTAEGTVDYFTTSPMNTEIDWNVEFGDIHYDGLAFTVTPTDDTVPYYFTVRPQFSHGGAMSDEELLMTIMAEDGMMMDYYAVTGEYESLYEWQEFILCSDTAYDLIIFAYSDGQPLSGVKKVPFRTKTPETAPADCTFELSYALGEGNATISVTPSDENLMYMWDVEDKNIVESFGGIEGYVDAYISDMIENNGAYELDFARVMGAETEGIGFVAGEYVIWAACVNERGEVVSPIAVEEFVMEDNAAEASAKTALGSMKKAVKRTSRREVKSMPQVDHNNAGQKLSLKMAAMMK